MKKVRPFHIKGLTLNTSPPQSTDADPAAIQRLPPGAMVETPGKVWAKSGQDLGKVWAGLWQSVGRTGPDHEKRKRRERREEGEPALVPRASLAPSTRAALYRMIIINPFDGGTSVMPQKS